jgi:KUP system potassium uptake protein
MEGSLADFIEQVHDENLTRVAGTAVFPHPNNLTVPLALRANVEFNRVLHEHIVIISLTSENVPHVPRSERLSADDLGYRDDGIVHLTARFGFQDEQDIPATLRDALLLTEELDLDTDNAYYYLSRIAIEQGSGNGLPLWQQRLFIALAHNAASPADRFALPVDRTVVMGSHIQL